MWIASMNLKTSRSTPIRPHPGEFVSQSVIFVTGVTASIGRINACRCTFELGP